MNIEELIDCKLSQYTLYETTDLDKFSDFIGNRIKDPRHIQHLRDSIGMYGMLVNPILVNEKLQVIDGQHTLEAARDIEELNGEKQMVYFIPVKGYGLEEIHALNMTHQKWSYEDFLRTYVQKGISSYIQLKEFMDDYPEFTIATSIALCANTISSFDKTNKYDKRGNRNQSRIFQEGTYEVGNMLLARTWADNIRSVKPYYPKYHTTNFVKAMVSVSNNPLFEFPEFIRKLKDNPNKLQYATTLKQYRLAIEDIINFNRPRDKKLNLRYN